MATYAVGDIQGCLSSLCDLLDGAQFNPQQDTLWVAGDLINRGPQSLTTLRYIKNLPSTQIVLGNHDLHLLAVAAGARNSSKKDTFEDILTAPDRHELLHWLQQQKLLHFDASFNCIMVHAGIPPIWSLAEAQGYAAEVETVLRSDQAADFFAAMYGKVPDFWLDSLSGIDRLRTITNYFTRMRFCDAEGRLELNTKTGPETAPEGFAPWFAHPNHRCNEHTIVFGHWAALQGQTGHNNFIALDTGCVWGGELTMLRLDDFKKFSAPFIAPTPKTTC